jgi:ubiquitin-conjugating enzyme E2 D/E
MPGPSNSPYENGIFHFIITIPTDYPFKPPKIICTTKIFHPNINENGAICMDILISAWSPAYTLCSVTLTLHSLLADPNTDDPLVPHAGHLHKNDRENFNTTAKKWTEDYASGPKESTIEVSRPFTVFK